jgi:threonylcarbamoyladenosine tRNA methylthiotransferase MtaB
MFEDAGYGVVKFEEGADLYIINTCSVTEFADRKCRYEVRRALKYSPDAKVVIIGCYAQLKPKEISEIPGVDLVLGAKEKFNILQYVDDLTLTSGKGLINAGEIQEVNHFVGSYSIGDRTRSFLKVQDGCDYKCSFCTIPQARGKSRSDTISNVLSNARSIAATGVKEIVLTGVNLGDFGNGTEVIEGIRPKKEDLFIDLIRELDLVEGIERFRISSIEPNLLTVEIIEFVAQSNRFAPHFHVPLQSGSDKMLHLMRRRYKRDLYRRRVEKIKALMPHACIGVDVIVGFPGETNDEFLETYHFLKDLDISYLHVFTYSERANTPAANMEGRTDIVIRRERNKMLRILSEKKKHQFYESQLNSVRPILVEDKIVDGYITGHTDNYVQVKLPLERGEINQVFPVKLDSISENYVLGKKEVLPEVVRTQTTEVLFQKKNPTVKA